MDNFRGLSIKQIQGGLIHYNKLKRFGRKDIFYSQIDGSVVLGPTAFRIYSNRSAEILCTTIDWKLFTCADLKRAVATQRKIFIIVHYVVLEEQKIIGAHVGLLLIDPADNQKARYIDTWPGSFEKPYIDTIGFEVPWRFLGGKKQIASYTYKFECGIQNSCALQCLHAIDRLSGTLSFKECATKNLFLKRMGLAGNNFAKPALKNHQVYQLQYQIELLYCLSVLLDKKIYNL